jgi:hypothetical protein
LQANTVSRTIIEVAESYETLTQMHTASRAVIAIANTYEA